jgi:predicted dehydrogenase
MAVLRGAVVGAGYFSQFHYEAWSRIPEVEIVALCDADLERAGAAAGRFGVTHFWSSVRSMLAMTRPDFLDVITPPATHLGVCSEAAERGVHIICQKPLAPTLSEAEEIVAKVRTAGVRCMVHENFRFQPWHREIKRLLDAGAIGRLHTLTFRSRPGDGWGTDAYLARQPYFRTMPRLLIHETGIHFIDTFRFLAGEVERVYAVLRRLNPVIAGEDCGLLVFEFASGAVGVWDANRCNESNAADPRCTFGEFLVEGDGGSIRLAADGTLTVQPPGGPERRHEYAHTNRGFGGDCVYTTQRHFIDRLLDGEPFETDAAAYLRNLAVEEAAYESARCRQPVAVPP